ncbi:MAG: tetratricopeptide repeat protein [Elusimicrobia bacterium]|nr:tetratricopeptide repeat protein [Elusimicrobiota bacterium]
MAALLVACAVVAAFSRSFTYGFVDYDDVWTLVQNPKFRGLGPAQLEWAFTTIFPGSYQPLTWLSYSVDYSLWGMEAGGYHLTSVLLHAANAALLCSIALRLLPKTRFAEWAAVLAALLFGLHPLRADSVVWISERKDVLSGLFYLLAIRAYVQAPERTRPVLGWFVLALLSKISVLTLPATLLILDVYPLRRLPADPRRWNSRDNRTVLAQKLPFAALSMAAGVFGAYTLRAYGGVRTLSEVSASGRIAMSAYGYSFYAAKTLVPVSLRPFYRLPPDFSPLDPSVLLAAAAGAAFLAAAWAARRRWPAFTVAAANYTLTIAPLLGGVKLGDQLVAEHYGYLPTMGFALAAGAGLFGARTIGAAGLAAAALAGASWTQTGVWRDSRTLWTHTLAVDPGNGLAHTQLAGELMEAGGAPEGAMEHAREAVRLEPRYIAARLNLASLLQRRGSLEEASAQAETAIALDPNLSDSYELLGAIRAEQKRWKDSERLRREALRLDPSAWRPRYNLAVVLAAQGRSRDAEDAYREAIRLDPPNPDAHNNLGMLLAGRGESAAAEEQYRQVLRIKPSYAAAHYNWGNLLSERGEHERAARRYQEAVRLAPALSDARFNLCNTRTRQKRWAEAKGCYREVLRHDPKNADAKRYLALVEAALGRR